MTTPGFEFGALLVFDGLMALIASIVVYTKDRTSILNRYVSASLFFFMLFFTSEGLIFVLSLPFITWFDFLRDITVTSAIIAAFFAVLSGMFVWKGHGERPMLRVAIFAIVAFAGILMSVYDQYVVYVPSTDIITYQNGYYYLLSSFLIPLIYVSIALLAYAKTLQNVDHSDPLYRKLRSLIIALILIVVGIVYYSIIESLYGRKDIPGIIGHVFYTGASILLIYAFSGKSQKQVDAKQT